MASSLTSNLNGERALIFRITHFENVRWILENGIPSMSSDLRDPDFVSIGNAELVEKRARRVVPIPPGGTLAEYVPFYFTPYSPMMYNIKTGYGEVKRRRNSELVIFVSSLPELVSTGSSFVFTDRHAYLQAATYYSEIKDLENIDFGLLQTKSFKRDPEDPGKLERYQAEALVYEHFPAQLIQGIGCFEEQQRVRIQEHIDQLELGIRTLTRPNWYFS